MGNLHPFEGVEADVFDFTLLFEQSVLSLLPSSAVLMLSLLRLYALRGGEPLGIQGRLLRTATHSAIASYAALQLAALVLWGRHNISRSNHVAVAATAVALFDACLFCPISWLEHTRSLQPSTTLLLYFSVCLLLDAFQVRTLWMHQYQPAILGTAVASLILKLVVVLLESVEKRRFGPQGSKDSSPEEWSGLWNRGFCCWLNTLLWNGHRNRLSADDLYPISKELSSEELDRGAAYVSSTRFLGIGRFLVKSLGWRLAYPVVPRMLLVGFNISQPLLIKTILRYLKDADRGNWPDGTENFIIIAVVLVYLGIALSTSIYWQLQLKNLTMVRGLLVTAIYNKVTTIPSIDQDKAAVILMSTDVEKITQGLRVFQEAWANLAEVRLAVWLLERELHVASIAPMVVATGVRLTGLTAFTPIFITPVACFAIHVAMSRTSSEDQPLDVVTAFTSLSLVPLAFAICDDEFGWTKDARLLRDINIGIPESQLTMIVGPVDSGKTTLCKILLGKFIIGFSLVDEAWYDTVIYASDLDTDLESLEKRDQTMVGNNGDALSTGQRQRVAVARAVYSRKPVIIMDDVFSGMDNITRNRIFSRLLGPHGILRMRKATVILACHDQQPMLSPDHVIRLRSDHPPVEEIPKPSSRAGTLESTVQSFSASQTSSGREGSKTTERQRERSKAAENKEARPRSSDWDTYKYFSSAVGLPNTFVLLALGAAFGVLYTFPSVWVNWWTADAGKDDFYLRIYALLQTAALACWFVFTRHSLTTVVSKSGSRLHDRLLSTATSATMPYLSSKDAGSIINRFSQDLQLVDGELPAAILNTIATAFIALAQVGLVATASPWLAVSYPFLLLVFFGVQRFYLRTSQQPRPLDLELKILFVCAS
ncbi:ABC multidrug transporter [Colletotrichum sojae]|uniref:ABC multidrug transporter n=1 Tax=Colletotrichum sojae TaxID=2175907 RepID=A0A8H6MRL4_9PEZI|nr:ABC multidrug transporter [Colletotrichum sojae]